jgi:hypothetical protein
VAGDVHRGLVFWVNLSEEAPRALFAQPRRHRTGRFAGIATTLVARADDPRDLADGCVVVDFDRGLRRTDGLPCAALAHDPVQPALVPVMRPPGHLALIAVAQLIKRAGRSTGEGKQSRVAEH